MSLKPEDIFLVDLCKWFAGAATRPTYDASSTWGNLIQRAHDQKVDRLLARFLISPPGFADLPYWLAQDLLGATSRRSAMLTEELLRIQDILESGGVKSLARKGAVYDQLLYGGKGVRTYFDNDFFVEREHSGLVGEILKGCGYRIGKFSLQKVEFVNLPRQDAILYQIRPDHLPHFFIVSDRQFAEVLCLDVALDMAWHGSPYSAYTDTILANEFKQPMLLGDIRTLSLPSHFIDCTMHLFREAYHERTILEGRDVSLRKFLDVWLMWRVLDDHDRSKVRELIDGSLIAPPCAWVVRHVDDVFGTDLSGEIGITVQEPIALNSWKSDSGGIGTWEGTMLDRIFGRARRIDPDPQSATS